MTMTIILTFGSSFQYGYNLWVVNHPAAVSGAMWGFRYPTISLFSRAPRAPPRVDPPVLPLTVVIYSLGGLTGSLMVCPMDFLCVYFSFRKGTLVIANLLAFISAIFMGFSTIVHTYEYAIFSRLLSGVCSGIFSCAVPLYLAEIAPRNLRGGIITMAMIAIGVGVLFSQILGLHEFLEWAILLSLTGILAVFQLLILPNFPESPRFLLIQRKNEEKARKVLRVLRDKEDVEEEIEELHQEDIAEMEEKELSVFNRLTYKGLRKQIIAVILLIAGQQFSGVNAVRPRLGMTYSVDSLGRRLLILVGFGTCSTFCVLLTISQELQVCPIPNIIIAELFLQSSRSTGIVLGGFVHWFLRIITGIMVFEVEVIGSYSFLLFWPLCIAGFVFIFRNIPETKRKSFLQIRNLLAAQAIKRINVRGSQRRSNPFKRLDRGRRKKTGNITSNVPSVPEI
uniref:Major facilitator superfamily (MFS) profile domain-containing protein n=1 Tax=Laticauda laticaudata TaxID=8630 RepID=A0A8C5RIB3_LATLA